MVQHKERREQCKSSSESNCGMKNVQVHSFKAMVEEEKADLVVEAKEATIMTTTATIVDDDKTIKQVAATTEAVEVVAGSKVTVM